MSVAVAVATPAGVVIERPGVAAAAICTISYTLAIYYLILGAITIIIPWALLGLFTLGSAFVMTVVGILLLLAAIAHLVYINRFITAGRRCVCP